MATIKSYTDIEQSKVLAAILPIESANMYYWLAWSGGVSKEERNTPKVGTPNKDAIETYWCPCWSLSALLSVLPDELGDNYFLTLDKEGNEYCCCYEDANGNSFRHCFSDNPVDACVAMIEKLHKIKMLWL